MTLWIVVFFFSRLFAWRYDDEKGFLQCAVVFTRRILLVFFFFVRFLPKWSASVCLSVCRRLQSSVDFLDCVYATHVCISVHFFHLLTFFFVFRVQLFIFVYLKLHLRSFLFFFWFIRHSIKFVRRKMRLQNVCRFRSGLNTSDCMYWRMHESVTDAEPIWNSYLRF